MTSPPADYSFVGNSSVRIPAYKLSGQIGFLRRKNMKIIEFFEKCVRSV